MVSIRVVGVTVRYGSVEALRNVTLSVDSGEVASLVGPNGSGKTTLLKTLDGILRRFTGAVYLDGRDVRRIGQREIAKVVGYVPQRLENFAPITVYDFVLTGRRPHVDGLPKREDHEAVEEALKLTGASSLRDRPITTLSGGELQRVLIARALAARPKVLLLDEPTANLDPKYQLEVLRILRSLAKSGLCVIMALHDLTHAYRYSEKVVMLKKGVVYAAGRPEEVITEENISRVYGVKAFVHRDIRAVTYLD
ncbi:ABC transporter ATP-binding protein [Infirmifilum sp. SLHALR2]|nr:MAG: iron ABC transporter ATP-binding protein [Thermofilum sp. NZ13]